jgi:hypothetical protein
VRVAEHADEGSLLAALAEIGDTGSHRP